MDSLVDALRDTLLGVRTDGRVSRNIAVRLRSAVTANQDQQDTVSLQEVLDAMPAFDNLPISTQQDLYAIVRIDDSWSMWFRRATFRQTLTRVLRTVASRTPPRYHRLRRFTELLEFVFLYWQARLIHMLYRRALTWRGWHAREPTLAAALQAVGLDARVIASSYLRHTPQPFDTAAYWHDPTHRTTVGVVVGIDFIVNDDGVWFVESNLNVGLTEERSELYESDPFVVNLVRFAKQQGYTSILYLACNDFSVDDLMAARIEHLARACGIRATIMEDRYSPQRGFSQTFLLPASIPDQTLVVRSKMFHTSLDAIFHHKTISLQALKSYQQNFHDHDVRLPPTGVDCIPKELKMDGPFPNLVCKFPERDQGQGVIFMKVPTLARAQSILEDVNVNRYSVANVWTKLRHRLKLEDQTSVFQTYVPSSLLEGRRLSVARAQVLATPVGIEFLSAHRIVSNLPVPESLSEGLVEDGKPYIVNYALDSAHAPMPPDEEARVRKASLSVVRALCWAVESRFETRPGAHEGPPE
jgi:hypothetical protein